MSSDIPAAQDTEGVRASTMAILVASAFVIGASETLMWLAMRSVMALGGAVASGGPYEIAVPSPGWLLALPASIIALVIAMQTSKGLSDSHDTPSLYLLAWSALFLMLGWNFLEFGLRAPGGGGLAIGWLVCAGTFALMGGGGLYAFRESRKAGRELDQQKAARTGEYPVRAGWRAYQIANTVAVAVGVVAGWGVFALVSR